MYDELMGNLPEKKFKISFNPFKKKDKKGEEVGQEDVSVDLLSGETEGSGEGMEMAGMRGGGDMKEFFGDSAVKDSDNENNNNSNKQKQALATEEV